MNQPPSTLYSVSDILEWDYTGQLEIAPKFQRGDVWSQKAKSYLIDTILRSLPIPPLFIRVKLDPTRRRSVREVVDGQQRIRAVLGYIRGDFPILPVHNEIYGGKYFDELPDEAKHDILGYHFSAHLLQNISEPEVYDIFARINKYPLNLTQQELRNAEFFGVFKELVYRLAHQHYAFWRYNDILSDQQIARMVNAELVSVILVTMIDGIRQTKDRDLREFYKKYDDAFPAAKRLAVEFESNIDLIGDIFSDGLKSTIFRRQPLFFSLFIVLYDATIGLPNTRHRQRSFSATDRRRLRDRFGEIDQASKMKPPPIEFQAFIDASRLSTADVGRRRYRHDFLWDYVIDKKVVSAIPSAVV